MSPAYNPKDVDVYIRNANIKSMTGGVNGISSDGIEVKFDNTVEPVNGIGGTTGYKIKGQSGDVITLNIVGTSEHASDLLELFELQMAGVESPFTIIMTGRQDSIGFDKIEFNNCFIIEVDSISITKSVPIYSFSIKCGSHNIIGKDRGARQLVGRRPSEAYVR